MLEDDVPGEDYELFELPTFEALDSQVLGELDSHVRKESPTRTLEFAEPKAQLKSYLYRANERAFLSAVSIFCVLALGLVLFGNLFTNEKEIDENELNEHVGYSETVSSQIADSSMESETSSLTMQLVGQDKHPKTQVTANLTTLSRPVVSTDKNQDIFTTTTSTEYKIISDSVTKKITTVSPLLEGYQE